MFKFLNNMFGDEPKSDWEKYSNDLNSKINDHAKKQFKAMIKAYKAGDESGVSGWGYAGNDNLTRYEFEQVQAQVRVMMQDYIKNLRLEDAPQWVKDKIEKERV